MINVALITPANPDGNFVPSLGLLTIAAVLEQNGHNVAVFDQNIEPDLESRVRDFAPDLLGVTAVTSAVLNAKRLAGGLKQQFPALRTVFGGAHPTAMAEEVICWPEVDFVVKGEGEAAMSMLADWLAAKGTEAQLEKIPNLYFKAGGLTRSTFAAPFLSSAELEKLPMPAYHKLDIESIAARIRHGLFRKGKRVLPYIASRGCPHNCTFCCRVMGKAVRKKNPEMVINEIEHLVTTYDLDEIYLEDDNFTSSKQYAMTVLEGIIARRLPISLKFANGIRIDTLDDELLATIKRAGCHFLGFGLESGSEKVLQLMRKQLDLGLVARNVKKMREHGFLVGANMIIGYPGESEADIWDSYAFFKSLELDSIAVVNLIPFPGTKVREICEQNNYLTEKAGSWDNYYFDIDDPKILIETEVMSAEDLQRNLKKVFFKLYFDRKRITTLIKNMSFNDILAGSNLMLRKIFKSFG